MGGSNVQTLLNPRFPLPSTIRLRMIKFIPRLSESLGSSSSFRPISSKELKARHWQPLRQQFCPSRDFLFFILAAFLRSRNVLKGGRESRLISNSIHWGTLECHQFCDLISYRGRTEGCVPNLGFVFMDGSLIEKS